VARERFAQRGTRDKSLAKKKESRDESARQRKVMLTKVDMSIMFDIELLYVYEYKNIPFRNIKKEHPAWPPALTVSRCS
jgi:hypothetical protein